MTAPTRLRRRVSRFNQRTRITQAELLRILKERAGGRDALSPRELANMLNESGLVELVEADNALFEKEHPPPPVPEGCPKNFFEALHTPGLCAIPVWTDRLRRWHFLCLQDGGGIQNIETGEYLTFDTYEEAITNLRAWHAHHEAKS